MTAPSAIDQEPHLDGAVRSRAPGRDAKEIAFAVDRDGALALGGTEQRTHLAAESQPVEQERTARSARHNNASLLDGQVDDRHRVRIEGEYPLPTLPRKRGRVNRYTLPGLRERGTLGAAESQRNLGRLERYVSYEELAAHERAQRKFDS